MRARLVLALVSLPLVACTEVTPASDGLGPRDLAVAVVDLAGGGEDQGGPQPDLASGCRPDPGTDGQLCAQGCPTGTAGVSDSQGTCRCFATCDPKAASPCVCGRSCRMLFVPGDGGFVPSGTSACVPVNGPAERCGADKSGKPFGAGTCGDGLLCVNLIGQTDFAYCSYKCTTDAALCPRGTTCVQLTNNPDKVCVVNSDTGGKPLGQACTPADDCISKSACDGATCRQQCDGPKDSTTCGAAKCTAVVDPGNGRISSYVCK